MWRRGRGVLVAAASAVCGVAAPLGAQKPLIIELRGAHPGPTLALVAGVHGGKVAAIRALQQLSTAFDTTTLAGRLLLVPMANAAGHRAGLAQTHPEDGLNLNRVFPGRADGTPTERLAHRLMVEIVFKSDYIIDLHGSDGDEAVGRFAYAARPGLDTAVDARALALATHWGTPRVVWDREGPRTVATSRFLQTAAHLSGKPSITVFEAGTSREDSAATAAFGRGIERLLVGLGMRMRPGARGAREAPGAPHAAASPLVHARRDVTLAPSAAEWHPAVRPDQSVAAGELLGTLTGSSGVPIELRAPVSGVVLHQRLRGRVAAQTPLIILADGPGTRDLPR
jgi:uncharacterized protein